MFNPEATYTGESQVKTMEKRQVPARRSIVSAYYRGKEIVRTNRAVYSERAVLHAVMHMRQNTYEATHVEVYDEMAGLLHAVVKRTVEGNVSILYKREYAGDY